MKLYNVVLICLTFLNILSFNDNKYLFVLNIKKINNQEIVFSINHLIKDTYIYLFYDNDSFSYKSNNDNPLIRINDSRFIDNQFTLLVKDENFNSARIDICKFINSDILSIEKNTIYFNYKFISDGVKVDSNDCPYLTWTNASEIFSFEQVYIDIEKVFQIYLYNIYSIDDLYLLIKCDDSLFDEIKYDYHLNGYIIELNYHIKNKKLLINEYNNFHYHIGTYQMCFEDDGIISDKLFMPQNYLENNVELELIIKYKNKYLRLLNKVYYNNPFSDLYNQIEILEEVELNNYQNKRILR